MIAPGVERGMACYVDGLANRGWKLRGHQVASCHMIADTLGELHAMAQAVGMRPAWFQAPPKASFPHYDLTSSRRAEALKHGAVPLDRRAFVGKLRELRAGLAARVLEPEVSRGVLEGDES